MSIALNCTCGNTFVAAAEWANRVIACPVCTTLINVSTGERVPLQAALADDAGILPDGEICLRIERSDEVVNAKIDVVAEPDDGRETYNFTREERTLASVPAAARFFAVIGVIPIPLPASCLAYGAGNEWALAGIGADVQILYMKAGERGRLFTKHEATVTSVALSRQAALTGDANGNLFWWELANSAVTHRQRAHVGAVQSLAIAEDGAHAVSGGADGVTRLWDLSCGCHVVPIANPGNRADVTAVAFSTDRRWLLAGDAEGRIDVWEVATGNHVQRFWADADPIACLRCHDNMLTAMAEPGELPERAAHPKLFRWDMITGRRMSWLKEPTDPVVVPGCVSLDRQGWRLLVAGRAPELPFHNVPVLGDAVSEVRDSVRDFFRIRPGTGKGERSLHIYSLATGAHQHAFPAVRGDIQHLAMSPENTRILASTSDGTLHVFALPEC